MLNKRKVRTAVRLRRVVVEDGRVPGRTLDSSDKGKEGKDNGSNTCATGYSIPLSTDKAYI